MKATTIDEAIHLLEEIIAETKHNENTMGYFAALYHKVTCKVKEGIETNFFDDGPRMAQLDVIFANRYLDAYQKYKNKENPTASWDVAFAGCSDYWYIILQHMLLGINAHINLDLGIAAATVSTGKNMDELKGDFDKINMTLAALVNEVEIELSTIWPTLKKLLSFFNKKESFLINFSMEIARDGAWEFAKKLAEAPQEKWEEIITVRDAKIAGNISIITKTGFIAGVLLGIIRVGEKGSVSEKIKILEMD